MTSRDLPRRAFLGTLTLASLAALGACGEADSETESVASERPEASEQADGSVSDAPTTDHIMLTEADADRPIDIPFYQYDLNRPDRKGVELQLTGDDASTLRWRFAEKPRTDLVDWYAVDGKTAFEMDGLIGDPTTAAKLLEFRGSAPGDATFVLELVEREPSRRSEPAAKRLVYHLVVQPRATFQMSVSGAKLGT